MLQPPVEVPAAEPILEVVDAIVAAQEQDINYFDTPLAAKAEELRSENNVVGAAVTNLLAAISTFGLNLDEPNSPFGPRIVMGTMRSVSIEDLEDGHFKMLAVALPAIKNVELRARVADVLWNNKKRQFDAAPIAINSYLEAAKTLDNPERWVPAEIRLRRAFQIAKMIGHDSENFALVEAYILERIRALGPASPLYFLSKLHELLLDTDRTQDEVEALAAQAKSTAAHALQESDARRARIYLELARKWLLRAKDPGGANAAALDAAETYVTESRGQESSLARATLLRQAVSALRNARATAERVTEIRRELDSIQAQAVQEMKTLEVSTDITDMVAEARDAAQNKTLPEAVQKLALAVRPPQMARLRKLTEDLIKEAPLTAMLSGARVDHRGRVIGIKEGPLRTDGDDRENAIEAEMHDLARQQHGLTVAGWANPFRLQLAREHTIDLAGLLDILRDRPFIPRGREVLFAKGLLAGFRGDFITASSVLVPQLEHAFRTLLASTGEIVYSQDAAGVQNLFDLNRTLDHEGLEGVLGEDYLFDLRGLLVSRAGTNFRNNVSHGLLGPGDLQSETSVYLWWITLHLIYAIVEVSAAPDDASLV